MSNNHDPWGDYLGHQSRYPRTFPTPYHAWHYRAMSRSCYFTDIDGVEVVGKYPVIKYEIKTIPDSLYQAILRNEDHSNPRIVEDLFARVDMWQLGTLINDLRPVLQRGLFLFTPPSAEAFLYFSFQELYKDLGPNGKWRHVLEEGDGTGGYRRLRKDFWSQENWKSYLESLRVDQAHVWANAEKNGLL